jgi:hypothetical protein
MTANKILISKLSYNPTKQSDKSKKTIEETGPFIRKNQQPKS